MRFLAALNLFINLITCIGRVLKSSRKELEENLGLERNTFQKLIENPRNYYQGF